MIKRIIIGLIGILIGVSFSIINGCSSIVPPIPYKANKVETFSSPPFILYDNEREWKELGDKLVNSKAKVIHLELNGYGGSVLLLDRFIFKIQQAQKQGKYIVVIILNQADSCHAIIACYANRVVYSTSSSYLMFHPVAETDSEGKFISYELGKEGNDNESMRFNYCKNKGLLSDLDIYHILTLHEQVIKTESYTRYQPDNR